MEQGFSCLNSSFIFLFLSVQVNFSVLNKIIPVPLVISFSNQPNLVKIILHCVNSSIFQDIYPIQDWFFPVWLCFPAFKWAWLKLRSGGGVGGRRRSLAFLVSAEWRRSRSVKKNKKKKKQNGGKSESKTCTTFGFHLLRRFPRWPQSAAAAAKGAGPSPLAACGRSYLALDKLKRPALQKATSGSVQMNGV